MIAIRPPEYFPRLAFLAHAAVAESLILADSFQYSRQSFQNRSRLRTPQGWQWISVPLVGGQHGRPIDEVQIDNRERWARKHWLSLTFNYSSTPFFEFYSQQVHDLLFQEWRTLGDLTCATIDLLAEAFGLSNVMRGSAAFSTRPSNLRAAVALLDPEELVAVEETAAHDATVGSVAAIARFEETAYRQNFEGFQPEMSALDLLFNYGPEAAGLLREWTRVITNVSATGAAQD